MSDALDNALLALRHGLVDAEDLLAPLCAITCKLPIYEYEHPTNGKILTKTIKRTMDDGTVRKMKTPVAYMGFDGEHLFVEREGKRTDIFEEGAFVQQQIAQALPAMRQRLIEDASGDPAEVMDAVREVNAFTASLA